MKEMNNNDIMLSENDGMDLVQMREQLGILKQKLDRQSIVTDKLLHQAMKQKMSWIQKYSWFQMLVLFPFICIGFAMLKESLGFSWWSYFGIVALTAVSSVSDLIVNKVKPDDWENDNLIQTATKLLNMKKIRKMKELVMIPFAIIVLAFLAYDCYAAGKMEFGEMVSCGIGALIGLIVGGIIGLRILFKMQRTNDDIIQQIEELTQNQEQ